MNVNGEMLHGIVVINMDRRPDRLRQVLRFLSGSDIGSVPTYRLAAHDGSRIDYRNGLLTKQAVGEMDALLRTKVRTFHAQLSTGAIGCYLSHLDAWKFIVEAARDDMEAPYLILEDDARVPPSCMVQLAEGWQLASAESRGKPFMLLGHIICLSSCGRRPDGLIIPDRFWSFQAYILNGRTAAALLAAGMMPMDVQIDSQVLYFRNAGLLNIYAYDIMDNGHMDTDIQMNIRTNAPLDRFMVYTP